MRGKACKVQRTFKTTNRMKKTILLLIILFSCTAIKEPKSKKIDFNELDILTYNVMQRYERGEISDKQINELIEILE